MGQLKREMRSTTSIFTIFSKALGLAYDTVKILVGTATVLAILKLGTAFGAITKTIWELITATSLYEQMQFWGKHAILKRVVEGLKSSYFQWSLAITAVAFALTDALQKADAYNEAVQESDKILEKSGHDSEAYINSIDKRIEAIKNRYTGFLYAFDEFIVGPIFRMDSITAHRRREGDIEITRLKDIRLESQQLVNIRERENKLLDEQVGLLDVISLKSSVEKKYGGTTARTSIMAEIRRVLSGGVNIGESSGADVLGLQGANSIFSKLQVQADKYGITLQKVNVSSATIIDRMSKAVGMGLNKAFPIDDKYAENLLVVYSALADSTLSTTELQAKSLENLDKRIREFVKNMKDSANPLQSLQEFYKGMTDSEKKAAGVRAKELKDYASQIEALKAELATLNATESPLEASISKHRSLINALQSQQSVLANSTEFVFKNSSKQIDQYSDIIREASEKFGVSVDIIKAVIAQESGGKAGVISGAGAKGLMQLMDSTAKELGVKNALNPRENIMGGTAYLKKMLDAFGGNLSFALAAYNAGPGAVKKAGGIPDIAETQQYVKSISQMLGISEESAAKLVVEYRTYDQQQKDAIKLLSEQVGLKKDELSLADRLKTADIRLLELSQGMVKAQSDLNIARSNYNYSLSGDESILRDSLNSQLEALKADEFQMSLKIEQLQNDAKLAASTEDRKKTEILIAEQQKGTSRPPTRNCRSYGTDTFSFFADAFRGSR